MESVSSIFAALGGVTAVAAMLGAPLGTISAWKTRDSIPSEYWDALVAAAQKRGLVEITFELLAKLSARRRTGAESPAQAVNQ